MVENREVGQNARSAESSPIIEQNLPRIVPSKYAGQHDIVVGGRVVGYVYENGQVHLLKREVEIVQTDSPHLYVFTPTAKRLVIHHIDGNPKNKSLENLELLTVEENTHRK